MKALQAVYLIVAVGLGGAVPFQAAINAAIGRLQGHSLLAAITNTVVASLALIAVIVVLRVPLPGARLIGVMPWWGWAGGLIGAAFVFGSLFLAPILGAAAFMSASILGTMVAATVLDHFGLFGFVRQPVSMIKLAGVAMVLGGVALIASQRH